MATIHRPARPVRATLAALGLVFTFAACSGGDSESDQAQTESVGLGEEATDAASAPDDSGSDDPAANDAAAEDPPGQQPQDSDLDIEMRNPDGTVLTLNHIAFEEESIVLDMDVDNGTAGPVDIHSELRGAQGHLRLVDDAGNTYNFVMPADNETGGSYLRVEQGETLSGSFAFLGPLRGHPEQLRLVTHVDPEDVDDWSLDWEENRGACCPGPGFVVPIELTWG
jgi:hypothetical protein